MASLELSPAVAAIMILPYKDRVNSTLLQLYTSTPGAIYQDRCAVRANKNEKFCTVAFRLYSTHMHKMDRQRSMLQQELHQSATMS